MQWHGTAATALVAAIAALASDASQAQVRRFVTPPRPGDRDPRRAPVRREDRQDADESGRPDPGRPHRRRRRRRSQIPPARRVIDLGAATVMPGMIDAHVHVNTGGATPRACGRSPRSPTPRSISRRASPPSSTWIRAAASTRSSCATPSTTASSRDRACRSSASRSIRAPPDYYDDVQSVALLRRLHREQEHQRAVARARRRARGEAARRRLRQDLHDAGFRRHDPHVESGRDARQQPVADVRRSRGDRRRSAPARPEGRLPHLRRRRHGQLHQGGRRCAQSPARARRRGRQDPARQEAALRPDHRRPDRARRSPT